MDRINTRILLLLRIVSGTPPYLGPENQTVESLCSYYTILYYTILYYTILYYTILYYTILYYTILYYTILYHATPCYTIPKHSTEYNIS